jgi:hypothetical protein
MARLRRLFALWVGSPAPYLVPVAVLLTLYHQLSASPWLTNQPTWAGASARSTTILFLAGPLAAGCAAWEMSRLRRAQIAALAPARSVAVIAAWSALPSFALGVVCVLTALLTAVPMVSGVPGSLDPRPVVIAVLVVAAHTLLGAAAGWLLSPYLSIPLALVASYVWHVYPRAIEPLWIRHLTGSTWTDCCEVDEMADPEPVKVSWTPSWSVVL